MKEILEKMMKEYPTAKNQKMAGHAMGEFIRNTVPNYLRRTRLFDYKYDIIGSAGKGRWAHVHWVGIFNRSLGANPQRGVFIVYLMSKDCKSIYLTFNQGCQDELEKNSVEYVSNNMFDYNTVIATSQILKERARKIISKIDSRGFETNRNTYNSIKLGNNLTPVTKAYESGVIFYKQYKIDNVPSDDVLLEDLKKMLDIYKEYEKLVLLGEI